MRNITKIVGIVAVFALSGCYYHHPVVVPVAPGVAVVPVVTPAYYRPYVYPYYRTRGYYGYGNRYYRGYRY